MIKKQPQCIACFKAGKILDDFLETYDKAGKSETTHITLLRRIRGILKLGPATAVGDGP